MRQGEASRLHLVGELNYTPTENASLVVAAVAHNQQTRLKG
jgi:hypothetical protein